MDIHIKYPHIFAHLYFMSAQLPRLAAILDKYPNMIGKIYVDIKCVDNDRLKTIDEIHEEIWEQIKKYI